MPPSPQSEMKATPCPNCSTINVGRARCAVCGGAMLFAGVRVTRKEGQDKEDPDLTKLFEEELGIDPNAPKRPRPAAPTTPLPPMRHGITKKPQRPSGVSWRKCRTCGKEFWTENSAVRFCSDECKRAVKDKAGIFGAAGGHYCEVCGAEIRPGKSKMQRFCSETCHDVYFSTHVRAVQASGMRSCRGCSTLIDDPSLIRCPVCGGTLVIFPDSSESSIISSP